MLLRINHLLYLSSLSLHANLSLLSLYISKDSSTHSPPPVLTDANLFSRFLDPLATFWTNFGYVLQKSHHAAANPDCLNQILND